MTEGDPVLAGILGVLMIAGGALLLLRAATCRWPDLVAKLVNLDAGPHGVAQRRPQQRGRRPADSPTPKSFEEELAALNDQLGRGPE